MTWPAVTTFIWSIVDGVTTAVTTVITVNPFVVSRVPFWPIVLISSDPNKAVLTPKQSIFPPYITKPLNSGQTTLKITTSGSATTILPPSSPPARHRGTFQPLPTTSVKLPTGPTTNPTTTATSGYNTVSYTHTHPTTTCTADCGEYHCSLFRCIDGVGSEGCGLFGRLEGCGIDGCTPVIDIGGGGGGDPNDPDECEGDDCGCKDDKEVTSCRVLRTETVDAITTRTGECLTTTCVITSCGTDTTKTSTTTSYEGVTATEVVEVTVRPINTVIVEPTSKKSTVPFEPPIHMSSHALHIALVKFMYKFNGQPGCPSCIDYDWLVYATDYNESVDYCQDEKSIYTQKTEQRFDGNKPFPEDDVGKSNVKKFDLKNCKFTANSSSEVGTLACDGSTMCPMEMRARLRSV